MIVPLAMKLREQGVPVKLVYLGHRDGSTLVVRKDDPARNAGDNAVLGPPCRVTRDQRGLPRPQDAVVDIGAYEHVASVQVMNTADNGPGSLREALARVGYADVCCC